MTKKAEVKSVVAPAATAGKVLTGKAALDAIKKADPKAALDAAKKAINLDAVKKASKAPEPTAVTPIKANEVTSEPEAVKAPEASAAAPVVVKKRIKVVNPEVAAALEAVKVAKAKAAEVKAKIAADKAAAKAAKPKREKGVKRQSAYKTGLSVLCNDPHMDRETFTLLVKGRGVAMTEKNQVRVNRAWDRATDIFKRLDVAGWLISVGAAAIKMTEDVK